MGTSYSFWMREDGKLPDSMKVTLARIFPSYAGKKISLDIHEAKDKRSLDQNSYYRGYILTHVRQVRFDNGDPISLDKAHEDLLEEFAPRIEGKMLAGKIYTRAKRTHEMDVKEMSDFVTAITATMANFGYPVPMFEGQHG